MGYGAELKEAKPAQVPDALDNLGMKLTELEAIVESLEKKLTPVLRNEPVTAPKEADASSVVPLVSTIRVHTNRIKSTSIRIADIINRTEL